MADPLITLTTDFGEDSPYVAALKGVILSINPAARLVDLSHQIPPQDVRHAAHFLAAAVPYFPPATLHVVVVDPGVGSERALLFIEVGQQRLLAPDNGCWTLLAAGQTPTVRRLEEPRWWRQPVSATFHGRDILAPVAGHLSLGLDPRTLGPMTTEWIRLDRRQPIAGPDSLTGAVEFVDHFGNLITNLPGDVLITQDERPLRITVSGQEVARRVRTYAEAKPGTLVALVSSTGMLEVAVVQGNAADQLQATVGTEVVLTFLGGAASGRGPK